MGLFTKESCCLCGNKAGWLDRKCRDGKVCGSCAKKLSVWFDDYKNADKDSLNAQIEIRKANKEAAKNCHFTKIFGEFGVILIDEENRKFIAFPDSGGGLFANTKTVNSLDDVIERGPDLIDFDMVEDFEIDITETSAEEKRTVNGQQESYKPPHYVYMEIFTLRLKLNHPYIKSIYIQLNNGAVRIHNIGRRLWSDPGRKLAAHVLGLPGLVRENCEAVYDNTSLLEAFFHSKYEMPDYSYGFACTLLNWNEIRQYHYYLIMAREIQQITQGASADGTAESKNNDQGVKTEK